MSQIFYIYIDSSLCLIIQFKQQQKFVYCEFPTNYEIFDHSCFILMEEKSKTICYKTFKNIYNRV